jgi:threonine/homoserine/homoserine lactone efflux protein
MHPSVLAAFAVALAIAVAIPGPGIFAVVSCAIGRGFREAPVLICGVIIGDLVYFYLAVLGMAALAHSMGEFFFVVKFAGAAYLIWLGLKLWRQKPAGMSAPAGGAAPQRGFRRSLIGGLVVTVSNPKATFIDLKSLSVGDAGAMGAIVVLVVGGIPAAYAYAAARSRRFFDHPSRMKLMHRTAGTMMIGAGVTVAAQ